MQCYRIGGGCFNVGGDCFNVGGDCFNVGGDCFNVGGDCCNVGGDCFDFTCAVPLHQRVQTSPAKITYINGPVPSQPFANNCRQSVSTNQSVMSQEGCRIQHWDEQKRKDCPFWRQFSEKPSSIVGMSTLRWEGLTRTVCSWTQAMKAAMKAAGHSIVMSTCEDAEASECQTCDQ